MNASYSLVTWGLLIDPVVPCCLGRGSEACPLLGYKSDPLESWGLLIDPIVPCHLGGHSEACLHLCCTNDSKAFRGLFIDLVFSHVGGCTEASPPCGYPSFPEAAHALLFSFVFSQVKMSLPATFAQHASSPSTAPGFCCSMRRTRTVSASTWSPGQPAARSRPGSPSHLHLGRRP